METSSTWKRRVYSQIYTKLVNMQNSYRGIAKNLSQTFYATVPRNKEEIYQLDAIEKQIRVAEQNCKTLEEVKYWSTMALLTEGSLIKDEELTGAILMLEDLLHVADKERRMSDDESILVWANDKIEIIEDTLQVLYGVLEHKTNRALETGEIKIQ